MRHKANPNLKKFSKTYQPSFEVRQAGWEKRSIKQKMLRDLTALPLDAFFPPQKIEALKKEFAHEKMELHTLYDVWLLRIARYSELGDPSHPGKRGRTILRILDNLEVDARVSNAPPAVINVKLTEEESGY